MYYFKIKIKNGTVSGYLPMNKRDCIDWLKKTYIKFKLIELREKVVKK